MPGPQAHPRRRRCSHGVAAAITYTGPAGPPLQAVAAQLRRAGGAAQEDGAMDRPLHPPVRSGRRHPSISRRLGPDRQQSHSLAG